MPLPELWVDHLFAKLSVRWGAAFMRQWPDTDPALVKADWSEVLDGCGGDSIAYALRYLPTAPCNALAFRDLCRRAPRETQQAITDDRPPADPERVRSIIASMRSRPDEGGTPAQRCADNIIAIARVRGMLSPPQVAQLRAMAHMLRADQLEEAEHFARIVGVEAA